MSALTKQLKQLSDMQKSWVIRMAWEDRCPFEMIEAKVGLTEAAVIRVMRRELKPSSFRMWRERVSGRVTKHRKRFEDSRKATDNYDL